MSDDSDRDLFLLELEQIKKKPIDTTNEEEILQNSIAIRDLIVRSNLNSALSGDTKVGNMVRAMLDSNDRSVYTARKLKVDDKNADANSELARYAAEIMDKHNVGVKRHREESPDDTFAPSFDLSEMPSVNLPDELVSTDDDDINISEIVARGLAKNSPSEDED